MDETPQRLLGLACGEPGRSAELLLRAALAAAASSAVLVELVGLEDLRPAAGPDRGGVDGPDTDGPWFWDRLVEYERVLKPRVAGFLAVGGPPTSRWKALTLPVLHTLTSPMQTAVVDQVVLDGAGTPRSIALDDVAMTRARRLGRAVAEQAGRPFDAVEHRGDVPGACPLCRLDVVVSPANVVECATWGARGRLETRDGTAVPVFGDLCTSVVGMVEKRDHFGESAATAAAHAAQLDRTAAAAARRAGDERRVRPGVPSRIPVAADR